MIEILTIIWSVMMIAGIVIMLISSDGDSVILSLNEGISSAAELFITIAPIMCFWSGIMEVCERCNITYYLSKLIKPLAGILFGEVSRERDVLNKITMNMSANLLGLGNAATPLGLCAIERLDAINPSPERMSDAMCMFIIINTASIQLIPTSVITLRSQYGSLSPSDILLPTIITTCSAFLAGTISAKLLSRTKLFL